VVVVGTYPSTGEEIMYEPVKVTFPATKVVTKSMYKACMKNVVFTFLVVMVLIVCFVLSLIAYLYYKKTKSREKKLSFAEGVKQGMQYGQEMADISIDDSSREIR
jgi:hypothetical protein